MVEEDHATKRPLKKGGLNWGRKKSPISLRFSQMLEKFRPPGNEENMSPEEWGSLIYTYVKNRGMCNGVYTFYELTEGSDTVGQKFHGLEKDALIESLKTLERKRKAEIFAGNEGVKFF